ncbi:XPA protein C-terminus-domain-containing protein, partial [Paraphysoderma sedebokerense]
AAQSRSTDGRGRPARAVSGSSCTKNAESATQSKKRSRMSSIFEFDMTDMVDTRGGFLLDEGPTTGGRKIMKLERTFVQDPPISLDPADNPKCRECNSVDLDHQIRKCFNVLVCKPCKKALPEKYSLITKTEAKEDYLLTESEVKDESILPHITKPNPRKNTWNNMYLYLREQVESFAIQKWGSLEKMDEEFERRELEKKKKKEKKFKEKLNDLRNRTRTSIWQDQPAKNVRTVDHAHEYGESICIDEDNDKWVQECNICGLQIEVEE